MTFTATPNKKSKTMATKLFTFPCSHNETFGSFTAAQSHSHGHLPGHKFSKTIQFLKLLHSWKVAATTAIWYRCTVSVT
jgi:hypothetical protein